MLLSIKKRCSKIFYCTFCILIKGRERLLNSIITKLNKKSLKSIKLFNLSGIHCYSFILNGFKIKGLIAKLIIFNIFLFSIINLIYADTNDAQEHFNKGMYYQHNYRMMVRRRKINNLSNYSNVYKAIDEFQYVVDKYPVNKLAAISQNTIAWLYFNLKDFAKAVDSFEKVILNYNNSDFADDAQYQLGYIHFLKKEYNNAIYDFQKTIDIYSSKESQLQKDRVPFAYFMIAESKIKQDKIDEAKEIYHKIINDYPNHGKARESKMRLNKL